MYKCQTCDKEFKTNQARNAHQIVHSNREHRYSIDRTRIEAKTYNCLYCGNKVDFGRSKINKYCNNNCQQNFQFKQYIQDWQNGLVSGESNYLKRYILEKQNEKCLNCGLIDWYGQKITLELDHIDGNSENNLEENLRCLCPNCHSQTSTFKGKNKGNGRYKRRQRYNEGKSS